MGDGAWISSKFFKTAFNSRDYYGWFWRRGYTSSTLALQSDCQHEEILAVSNGSDLSSSTNSRDQYLTIYDPSDSGESSSITTSDSTHSVSSDFTRISISDSIRSVPLDSTSITTSDCTSSLPSDSTSLNSIIGDPTKVDCLGKREKRRLTRRVLILLVVVIVCVGIAGAIAAAVLFTRDEVQTFSGIVRVNETFHESMAQNDSDTFQSFGDRFCFNVVSFLAGQFR
ncbi:uncharacterized protein LOC112554897 isoform X1 [Pomacea canaliculata]|uniref:uncharacterized protein LOC112554897 isoform X1 n=1 Tax=Pomacea canaliculata TaxID=400727 RepID=UPI000D73469F|nr:uncharacterized protein LOC112554897 isoform X1 [Pomacea canaliculata]